MTTKKDVLLIRAARSGDIKRVQALLAAGADANTSDHDGTTALMFAALAGYTEIVRLLLAQGADINMPRKLFGVTALMLAAKSKLALYRHWSKQGRSAKNDDGSIALMAAALKGDADIANSLECWCRHQKDKDEDTLNLAAQVTAV